jgi:hypothetical protein
VLLASEHLAFAAAVNDSITGTNLDEDAVSNFELIFIPFPDADCGAANFDANDATGIATSRILVRLGHLCCRPCLLCFDRIWLHCGVVSQSSAIGNIF